MRIIRTAGAVAILALGTAGLAAGSASAQSMSDQYGRGSGYGQDGRQRSYGGSRGGWDD